MLSHINERTLRQSWRKVGERFALKEHHGDERVDLNLDQPTKARREQQLMQGGRVVKALKNRNHGTALPISEKQVRELAIFPADRLLAYDTIRPLRLPC